MKKKIFSSKGATAVEYALIAALIAIVSMGPLKTLGIEIKEKFNSVINVLRNVDANDTTGSYSTNNTNS